MKKRKTTIGGQAVLEGVMMKSAHNLALAVRTAEGDIALYEEKLTPLKEKNKLYGRPIVRGAVNMLDMLQLGMRVINKSVELSGEELDEEPSRFEKWLAKKTGKDIMDIMMPVAVVLAIVMAIGLYIVLPSVIVRLLQMVIHQGWIINIIEGLLRMGILVVYLVFVSKVKDISRLLAYHGAEHKTISTYEYYQDLTVENAKKQSRFHPQCGTSFIFLIMLLSIMVFMLFGTINALWLRILVRILMIPVIAGLAYELLKVFSNSNSKFATWIKKPGMAMQRLTTKEPDDDMLEVAIAAFEAVLAADARDVEEAERKRREAAEARRAAEEARRAAEEALEVPEEAEPMGGVIAFDVKEDVILPEVTESIDMTDIREHAEDSL